jgi:hypothetical protein
MLFDGNISRRFLRLEARFESLFRRALATSFLIDWDASGMSAC